MKYGLKFWEEGEQKLLKVDKNLISDRIMINYLFIEVHFKRWKTHLSIVVKNLKTCCAKNCTKPFVIL